MNKLILGLLILGIFYRLLLTSNGNFLFNMDNARDMVDVREMVELKKLRFTGPNSAIEGLYNGPLWYYLLAIPYLLTHGDPYGAIVMEIILWVIGGFYLLKLVGNCGKLALLSVGLVWVTSNYIVLTNLYAFNPNPVTLLAPLFIYALVEYLKKQKEIWIIVVWFLAGAFFNFEMNFGIFTPLIIFISILMINKKLIKDKYFWIGFAIFTMTLIPQLLFDIKHQFIMSRGVLKFISESKGGFNPFLRIPIIWNSFFNVFQATLMNQKNLLWLTLILGINSLKRFLKNREKNIAVTVCSLFILIPFIGYTIFPITVNPWHLGGPAAVLIILIGFIINSIWRINFLGKILSLALSVILIWYSVYNIVNFFMNDLGKPGMDPSLYRNEIAAIDYVYKYANNKNFKVYTYLPSVIDYPYQYLIWWYGLKNFGYLPKDYAYAPNKPPYISNKSYFSATEEQIKKRENSNLVFLIKEPNRNYTRFGWEGDFIKLKNVEKQMVGPLEIEVRKEE